MSLLQKLKARRAKRLEQRLVRLFENVKLPEINPEITGQNTVIAWDKVTKLSEELAEQIAKNGQQLEQNKKLKK